MLNDAHVGDNAAGAATARETTTLKYFCLMCRRVHAPPRCSYAPPLMRRRYTSTDVDDDNDNDNDGAARLSLGSDDGSLGWDVQAELDSSDPVD